MRYLKKSKVKNQKSKLILLILFFTIMFTAGCGQTPIVKKTKPIMGTWASIKIHDSSRSEEELKELIDKAFSGIEKVDELMSAYSPDSEISRINKSKPDEPIKLSAQTLAVIDKAGRINQLSGGAFDITVGPLINLWRSYGAAHNSVPPENEILKTMELVGHERLIIDKEYGYVGLSKEGMALDLGGIAQGFAVDEAVNILKREGARNALIDVGGEIYCLGNGPGGVPWKVGIKHPRKDKIIATLELKDIAVSTSGDYENHIVVGNRFLSHIIDPKRGSPVKEMPASVTVLAGDCATADSLATALAVLGPEKGLSLANRLECVEAVIITDNAGSLKVYVSEGLKGLYEFQL